MIRPNQIDSDSTPTLFKRWDTWHLLSAKFASDSPIRRAQDGSNTFLHSTTTEFFHVAGPYLFTVQGQALLNRLIALSRHEGYSFHNWWRPATAFALPLDPERLRRDIWITIGGQRKLLRVSGDELRLGDVQVDEVSNRNDTTHTFWLGVWDGADDESREQIIHLEGSVPNHQIFFTADFDRDNTFNVNHWAEVVPYLE